MLTIYTIINHMLLKVHIGKYMISGCFRSIKLTLDYILLNNIMQFKYRDN